jgi:hypothetical protein
VLYGEYARVQDARVDGTQFGGDLVPVDSTVWGLGIVQHIDAAAMELFLSYRQFSAENTSNGADFDNFDVVMGGARIKF